MFTEIYAMVYVKSFRDYARDACVQKIIKKEQPFISRFFFYFTYGIERKKLSVFCLFSSLKNKNVFKKIQSSLVERMCK
ncbi:hypothetical protein XELAEV_18047629mg [Xenopus laevis]|uniref:Uncharacterized protein n=1 Tax=Xenopus laevis TaxID=8355 RepID=A0A974BVJ9_XENLA|nr:hypothetical protein XELAEV_18047629mg [Xenopus laevis]